MRVEPKGPGHWKRPIAGFVDVDRAEKPIERCKAGDPVFLHIKLNERFFSDHFDRFTVNGHL
ncbi:MAG: hypothetical protein ACYTCN_11385 [Planctomycetota bacterium]